jgi:Glycosyltransferase family 87
VTRRLVWVAAPAVALFVVCCAVVRGGLFDDHPYGDAALYGHYAHEMTSGRWPYGDFFDEYPVFAQPLFVVVRLLPGAFTDTFKWTMAVCGAIAILLLLAAMQRLGAPSVRLLAAAAVAGASPVLVGPVFLNTYDLFAAALTAAAVLAFVLRRERLAYVLLALAVAAKVYPLVLLPLVLVDTWERGGRDAVKRAVVWFAGVLALVHLPFLVVGPGGLRYSYWLQLRRGLEVESLAGGFLLVLDRVGLHQVTMRDESPGSRNVVGTLADALATLSSLVVIAAVILVVWLYVRRNRDFLLAAGAAVTAFVAFGKVLSPQYVVWLVPIVPAAGVAASAGLVAVLALTHAEFNRFAASHGTVDNWGHVVSWWVLVRDLALVALFVLLALRLRAAPRSRTSR